MNERDRRRFEQLRADRHDIERAAAWLRAQAWQKSYAGLHDKDRAIFLAGLLDTLSLQLDRVDSAIRWEAVRTSRWPRLVPLEAIPSVVRVVSGDAESDRGATVLCGVGVPAQVRLDAARITFDG